MEPLVIPPPRHSPSLLPIFFLLGITLAAYIVLSERIREDQSLLPQGEVIVVERNVRQSATLLESGVESEPEAATPTTVAVANTSDPTYAREENMLSYVEIVDSCGPHYEGACVNARSGPSTTSPAAMKLRTGVVLRTAGIIEADGIRWHRIIFDEWVRYPDRIQKELYVAETYGVETKLEPPAFISSTTPLTTKRILVDRSEQKLYAHNEDGSLFMEKTISTGRDATPTPRGVFTIFKKVPSRYMQGPLPGISADYYDLPGVPWNLYFTAEGGALHGAYWHDKFGQQWSHGCVNLPLEEAKALYFWADLGTSVTIRD